MAINKKAIKNAKKAAPKKRGPYKKKGEEPIKKVNSMQEVWKLIDDQYEIAEIDPFLLAKNRTAKPYDIRVLARIADGEKQSEYSISMTNFFLRNPMANFEKVIFLQPKPAGKKKSSNMQRLAVFDSSKFQVRSAAITRKPGSTVAEIRSKAHVLQLFQMFGITPIMKPGAITELFIKLTPMMEGETRDTRKVCRMTLFTQL